MNRRGRPVLIAPLAKTPTLAPPTGTESVLPLTARPAPSDEPTHAAAPRAKRTEFPAVTLSRLAFAVDVVVLALVSLLAVFYEAFPSTRVSLLELLVFDATTLVLLSRAGSYGIPRRQCIVDDAAGAVGATAGAAATLIAVVVVTRHGYDIGQLALRLWAVASVALVLARAAVRVEVCRSVRAGSRSTNALIVGSSEVDRLVACRLLANPHLGVRPIGFLDDEPAKACASADYFPVPRLGATADLARLAQVHGVGHVVVGFCSTTHEALLPTIQQCRRLRVQVMLVPRLYEEMTARLDIDHLGAIPLLRASRHDPRCRRFAVKYVLDRVTAAIVLVVLSPLMAVLALAVRLSSPGPVLYRQRRVGRDGREFDLQKFRTMRDTADAHVEPGSNVVVAMLRQESLHAADDRRTRLGRWMRRYSVDELPQLLNVIRGEMSLVGPRPERPSLADGFGAEIRRYHDRHRVKSGMTGWAQVHGLRGPTSLSDRVEWDNFYIENWSFGLDLKILLLTVPSMLRGRGAE